MLPLDDITVVALEQAVAAPFATRQLADLGARVIKIERPETGDFARHYDTTVRGMSSHFVWLNRSKESVTLDLKKAGANEIMHRLLDRADVFVQNLLPGAVERLGLGADTLRARYPSLIVCNISGYGPQGPDRDRKAYDLLIQAEAGLLSVTGTAESPAKVGISVADIAAGMYAYSGILTALIARQRTGQGTTLNIAMLDALGEWMGYPAYYRHYGGHSPDRTGAHHAAIAPYGPYPAGNGQLIYLGIQNDREWQRFCIHVLEREDLAENPRFGTNMARVAHRDELDQIITECFRAWDRKTVLARLDRAQIANARLNDLEDFWNHPQLRWRNRWVEVDSPVGPLEALIPPAAADASEVRIRPVPSLGQHTVPVLQELGYGPQAIDAWRETGVI